MSWFDALMLGLVQGLTEFLPVSSSGHLEIGKVIMGEDFTQNILFTVVVHGATVLSILIVFRQDIIALLRGFFKFKKSPEWTLSWKLIFSMIPVGIVGFLFSDQIESLFTGNLKLVGGMLIVTAILLIVTKFAPQKEKQITFLDAFLIGIAQAIAVIPGISRSGATIATGLYLGNKKEEIARFSFLMVIIPVLAANGKEMLSGQFTNNTEVGILALATGFIVAFISGFFACKWMIGIVKKGNLIYFAIYCLLIGSLALILG